MGFDNLGLGEVSFLLVMALFVFGPDRLPHYAAEAGRTVRKVRTYLKGMTDDLQTELGPELGGMDLASLHPKALVKKHLWDDEDDASLAKELSGKPMPVSRGSVPLTTGEAAPWDPDTT